MARTTATAVKGIIETDDVNISDLTPFIDTANGLVEELLAEKHDSTRLELIERWLAAHFYAIRDNRPSMESVGSVSEHYQHKLDTYLGCTMYGQSALALDTSGELAKLNKKMKEGGGFTPTMTHLGSQETGA